MVLVVNPYRLDGPGGEPVYEADWDEEDEERLQTLRKEYQDSSSE